MVPSDKRDGSEIDSASFQTEIGTPTGRPDADDGRDQSGDSQVVVGSHIGRYVVLSKLGEGGMGMVFAAFDPQLDRKVALKLVKPNQEGKGRQHTKRLLQEAKSIAKLAHPNVVTVFDAGIWREHLYVAMEYVEGRGVDQWLGESVRSWQEVMSVFCEAGKGLAAAHAKGIIHRDFKPSNTLLGEDGRARVIDFGLAKDVMLHSEMTVSAADSDPGRTPASGPTEEGLESIVSDDGRVELGTDNLTMAGTAVGTLEFMSPEQHLGKEVGPQSDQFNFCASLYLALYRELPFCGKSLEEIYFKKLKGRIPIAPAESNVPPWLRKIVLRGLSPSPEKRWPNMEVLISQLAYDPAKKRRRLILAGVLLIALGATIFSLMVAKANRERMCEQGGEQIVGIWDPARKQEIQKVFLNTKSPFAEISWNQVEKQLDVYTKRWKEGFREACQATRILGKQSEQMLDLRMLCLNRRFNELKALLDVFARADAKILERVVEAAGSLERVERCANTDALMNERLAMEQPKNPEQVEETRKKLAEVMALEKSGEFQQGLQKAQVVLKEAQEDKYLPLEAEANYWVGLLAWDYGAFDVSEEALKNAMWQSTRVRHDQIAMRAARILTMLTGGELFRKDEWSVWRDHTKALLDRPNQDESDLADFLDSTGWVYKILGDYSRAREYHEKAFGIRQKILGSENIAVAKTMQHIADVKRLQGLYQETIPDYEQVMTQMEKILGPSHPDVGQVLFSLASATKDIDPVHSIELMDRVLSIYERVFGPKTIDVARALQNKAMMLSASKQHDKAIEVFKQTLSILNEIRPAEDPDIGNVLVELGAAYFRKGEFKDALQYYLQGLSMVERTLGKDHPWVAETLMGMARVYDGLGQYLQAIEAMERSVQLYKQSYGANNVLAGEALALLGELQSKNGRNALAVPLLENALSILQKSDNVSAPKKASVQFDLAKALIESGGDKKKALELARQSVEILNKFDSKNENEAKEIERWIKANNVK